MKRHHTTHINCAFVKVKRKAIGITQYIAAKRSDISQRHWINIENGRAKPSLSVVIRMAKTLKCRPDELLTSTADMSINYLEKRMQETIQEIDPLDTKDFLLIAKMLGYFDSQQPREVGYDAGSQVASDEALLTEYEQMYNRAIKSLQVDTVFLEFIITERHHLQHLLSSQQRQGLETYLNDRGMGRQEAIEGEVSHETA